MHISLTKKRVFYYDTDCGGLLYHGSYLKFFEEARTEFLESIGLSIKGLMERDIYFVVRQQSAEYLRPAFYGDILQIKTKLTACTAVRMEFAYELYNQAGALLTKGTTLIVSIGKNMRAKAVPADILAKFKAAIN